MLLEKINMASQKEIQILVSEAFANFYEGRIKHPESKKLR
jgi:anti-sigma regulatory factor (Ser/Thr protein kinase)